MKQIVYNRPLFLKSAIKNFKILKKKNHFSSAGFFSQKCEKILHKDFGYKKVILTNSCTQALEFVAMLLNIKSGDEIIVPSYTFVSSANAFVNFNAKPVFVDIDKKNCNIQPEKILSAISKKTKAIVVVHYAGYTENIDKIAKICRQKNIFLIEDCAHSFACKFKNKYLGTFGDFAALSFHETKNIHCGEGGALIINNNFFFKIAETMKYKGTNRSQFVKRKVNKYSWQSKGSSFMMSEIKASFLYSQLKNYRNILSERRLIIQRYYDLLKKMQIKQITIPNIYNNNENCYHLFYIFVKNKIIRKMLLQYLDNKNINATFHYIPLHSSRAGKLYGKTHGGLKNSNLVSNTIIRLPLWNGLKVNCQQYIVKQIKKFFENEKEL